MAACKPLQNMPKILIVSSCSLIVVFSICFCKYVVLSVLIDSIVVFSRLMVAPVAKFNFLKNSSTFSANS